MTLQQLKYAVEVAKLGSINEAAKRLFVSQPRLSNTIKELEQEMKIEIFTRTNKGIQVTLEGAEFLGYARQVLEQADLLEQRYGDTKPVKQNFCVSTQHYAFAVNAFVELMKEYGQEEYECSLRETKTYEIIDDVKNLRSEIGIIYINEFNKKVMYKLIKENNLTFTALFTAKPHVFISSQNPLAAKKSVRLEDLEEYPYLSFEQGDNNSFYFSEEILSTRTRRRNIHVSDRATLFNLLIGLNGYTISTGIISAKLNGDNIIAVPLSIEEDIIIGYLTHNNSRQSELANRYIMYMKQYIVEKMD
ncbi:LysR family transcriptional regulator [Anaerosporobacter faecicola]|uniref:LysR family transcriptional regulator n=1 Tax=Anaerosporobacter faecicola TaxID=2718714 RepID=UPI00143BF5E9|nr:LysR family transcriptional regulator [Anaerosporobacter faecicola]